MKKFFCNFLGLKTIAFLSYALLLSGMAMGQTTTQPPATATVHDDDMDTDSAASNTDTASSPLAKMSSNKFIVFADFGGATIYNTSGGATTSASGLTWALSGQLAHEFKVKGKGTRMFLSFGLEAINYNGTSSAPDGVGSTAYNNYHYWYAGVPVMFQVVHTIHKTGKLSDWGYYAQAGLALGFKVDMLDVYSIQGVNTWNDVNDNYTTLMLNTCLGAGVAYKTKSYTYELGPYAGYVASNISKQDGVKENVLSYGIRLSMLLFK